MKSLKLSLVAVISLLAISQFAFANSEPGTGKFYNPETSANARAASNSGQLLAAANSSKPASKKAARADVAGFVIAANGTVTATNEAGEIRSLARRSRFYSNETLKTGADSRAQLRFKDRALMTLRSESELNIEDYHFGGAKDPANKSFMTLVSGGFRTISGTIGKADRTAYRISTPAASIGIRGTDYELVISLGGKVFAAVHDGGITLVNDIGELDLGSDSDYFFAEVGAGQSPLGLSEQPEVFKIEDGEKAPLTEEQKAKVTKKLAEGEAKIRGLLADLGGPKRDNDRGDAQDRAADGVLAGGDAPDTRLPAELLKKLKEDGQYAVNAGGLSGDIQSGLALVDGNEVIFLTDDSNARNRNQMSRFNLKPMSEDGEILQTKHENVVWGKWDKGVDIGAGGSLSPFVAGEDQYFLATQRMGVAAIQNATGRTTLDLAAFNGGTTHPELADVQDFTGSVTLDFSLQTVDGVINLDLLDAADNSLAFNVEFDGDMLNGDSMNTDYSASAEAGGVTLTSGVTVRGAIAEPTDSSDMDTAGFAGGFDASLPTEVTDGVKVGVRGLFVFSNNGEILTKRMKPAPFL